MPTPGPGHNSNAFPEEGFATRTIAWRQAKASQKTPSPQVVKMMLARAKELGISYADYASLVRTGGRDIGAFLRLDDRLSEDTRASAVRRCVDAVVDGKTPAVLCSHRPTLPWVFDALGIETPDLAPGEGVVVHHRRGTVLATEPLWRPTSRP